MTRLEDQKTSLGQFFSAGYYKNPAIIKVTVHAGLWPEKPTKTQTSLKSTNLTSKSAKAGLSSLKRTA